MQQPCTIWLRFQSPYRRFSLDWGSVLRLVSCVNCEWIKVPSIRPLNSKHLNISSSLVQSTWSKTFFQSVKHNHVSSVTPNTLSGISFINPIVSVVPLPFRNSNWSSSITSFILLFNLFLNIRATIFPVCKIKLIVLRLLHFLCLIFFGNAITVIPRNYCPESIHIDLVNKYSHYFQATIPLLFG